MFVLVNVSPLLGHPLMPACCAPLWLASGIYHRPTRPRVNAWTLFVTDPSLFECGVCREGLRPSGSRRRRSRRGTPPRSAEASSAPPRSPRGTHPRSVEGGRTCREASRRRRPCRERFPACSRFACAARAGARTARRAHRLPQRLHSSCRSSRTHARRLR